MKSSSFHLGKDHLTASIALAIARGTCSLEIDIQSREKIIDANESVRKIAIGEKAVYGINTGFGPLCRKKISAKDTEKLQEHLLLSHSVGVGEYIDPLISKLMLILKVHSLCQGFSGVSVGVIERLIWHIKEDLLPAIPSQGSVGASGDLAPLAHMVLPLIGEGKIHYNGKYDTSRKVLSKLGVEPLKLGPKDGLALINGTQFIAAHCVLLVEKFYNNLSHSDLIGAMTVDALKGSSSPFASELHELRPFPANMHVAGRVSSFLAQSEILESHKTCNRVQDPYSLRCIPQVHGASRNAWLHLKEALEIELNAVTDNPIVFRSDHTISGGNFHGQPLALPIDYACLANAELGSISDRRMYLSLEGRSVPVPKLLMNETGLNSGFMILQYTAAALASENKTHCFPASADSIMTSLGQEDHVSMGSIGARKALQVAQNTEKILALELMCAAQALDFHRPLKSSKLIEEIHRAVREKIAFAERDRLFADDIEACISLLYEEKLITIAKEYKDDQYSGFDDLFEVY